MSSDALGWAWKIRTGDNGVKGILMAMAELTVPPDRWNSNLSSVRHLVHSPLGVSMGSQATLMRMTDVKSPNTIVTGQNLLMASGVMLPAHQDIPLMYANGFANRATNGFEPNAVIDSRREDNPWIAEAIHEAKAILRKGAGASKYDLLGEAMQDLCPLAERGFVWVDTVTVDEKRIRGGHWSPLDTETHRVDEKRTPKGRVVLHLVRDVAVEGVETPQHWVDAEDAANTAAPEPPTVGEKPPTSSTVDPTPEPDPAGGALFTTPADVTPEGLPALGKEPPVGPERDAWRRENYRWEQTAGHPRKGKKRLGRSECAWLIADTRFRDFERPPVGGDGGQKFMIHHERLAQSMLTEGWEAQQIVAALRELDFGMPPEGHLRQVLRGRYSVRRATGSAVDGIRAANEGAGKPFIESEENLRWRTELLASFQADEKAEGQ